MKKEQRGRDNNGKYGRPLFSVPLIRQDGREQGMGSVRRLRSKERFYFGEGAAVLDLDK